MNDTDKEIFKDVCMRMNKIGVLSEPEIIVTLEKEIRRMRDRNRELAGVIDKMWKEREGKLSPGLIPQEEQDSGGDTVIRISSPGKVSSVDVYFVEDD